MPIKWTVTVTVTTNDDWDLYDVQDSAKDMVAQAQGQGGIWFEVANVREEPPK